MKSLLIFLPLVVVTQASTTIPPVLSHLQVLSEDSFQGLSLSVNSNGHPDKAFIFDSAILIEEDPDLRVNEGMAIAIADKVYSGYATGDEEKGGCILLEFELGTFSSLSTTAIDADEPITFEVLNTNGDVIWQEVANTANNGTSDIVWSGSGGQALKVTFDASGAFTVPAFTQVPEPSVTWLSTFAMLLLNRRTRNA